MKPLPLLSLLLISCSGSSFSESSEASDGGPLSPLSTGGQDSGTGGLLQASTGGESSTGGQEASTAGGSGGLLQAGTGGTSSTGGLLNIGGHAGNGTGGTPATGGIPSTGGAPPMPCGGECPYEHVGPSATCLATDLFIAKSCVNDRCASNASEPNMNHWYCCAPNGTGCKKVN
jgi:hypothetical protein